MFTEDDLLPISGLHHVAFCERRCALIHIERIWIENQLTAEGRVFHERTHERQTESRPDLRVARGLQLRSLELGLSGVADVVEFHRVDKIQSDDTRGPGVMLREVSGCWRPFPVEYKRGKPRKDNADKVQLCAQAMCLEEMLGAVIEDGAIFYGRTRRREEVLLTPNLRDDTRRLAERLHELVDAGIVPTAEYDKNKCPRCSLLEVCRPKAIHPRHSARRYLERAIEPEGPP